MSAIKYRPEIDGLRAIAVIPVIVFHLSPRLMPGGNLGVDVFFVISGYLITSIVKHELDTGTFSLRQFWGRRIRRILPAMTAVIATSLAVTYFFVFKGDQPVIARQSLAAMFSFANFYFWRAVGDYWGPTAAESPMLHTWSLSVEEQFYLIFPLAIWLLYRYRSRWLPGMVLAVAVVSLTMFLFGAQRFPEATFYLLPMRAWELAAGCYLALWPRERPTYGDGSLGLAGLGMIVASYFFVSTLGPGVVIAVLGTVLVVGFAQSGVVNRILSLPVIVFIGKLSYSLYLWHWPVIVFLRYFFDWPPRWMLICVMLILSLASYFLVESTTRRRRGIIPIILGFFFVTVLGGGALILAKPFYDSGGFSQPTYFGFYYDCNPHIGMRDSTRQSLETVNVPRRPVIADAYKTGGFIIGPGTPKVVVLGDSHAAMWCEAIHQVTAKLGLTTSFWCMNGVTPFVMLPVRERDPILYLSPREKYEYDTARLSLIKQWKPQLVILGARWAEVSDADPLDLLDFISANSSHVLLIEQPPELPIGYRNCLQYMRFQGVTAVPGKAKYYPFGNVDDYQKGRARVRSLTDRHENCRLLPTFDLFTSNGQVRAAEGVSVLYLEQNHLTAYGTGLVTGRLEQTLVDLLHPNATKADSSPKTLLRSFETADASWFPR